MVSSRGREDEGLLVRVEVDVQNRHRRFAAAQREGDPGVAVDDAARPLVDEDLPDPANGIERPGQRVLLRLGMNAPVARVGEQLVRCLLAGPGDPVAPGGGRRRGGGAGGRPSAHRATWANVGAHGSDVAMSMDSISRARPPVRKLG